jgi:hypothetical protein
VDITGQERFGFARVADVMIAESAVASRTLAIRVLDEGTAAVLAGDGGGFEPFTLRDESGVETDSAGDVGGDARRGRVVDEEPALVAFERFHRQACPIRIGAAPPAGV